MRKKMKFEIVKSEKREEEREAPERELLYYVSD